MTTVQISEIQLRRGLQSNMPGAAPFSISTSGSTTSGNILHFSSTTGVVPGLIVTGLNIPTNTTITTFVANTSVTLSNSVSGTVPSSTAITFLTPVLDDGEMAFATDANRLFIGPDTTAGGSTLNRASFPYANVEVLTELSPTVQTLFNSSVQDMQLGYIKTNAIPINSGPTDWTTVTLGTGSVPLRLDFPSNTGTYAQITYFLINSTQPFRVGTATVIWDGASAGPFLVDDVAASRAIGVSSLDPLLVYGSFNLRAVTIGSGPSMQIVLQACNLTSYTPRLYYRIERTQAF